MLSRAIRRISCSISAAVLGRPTLRVLLPLYFWAMSLRYQRSNVVRGHERIDLEQTPATNLLSPLGEATTAPRAAKHEEPLQRRLAGT